MRNVILSKKGFIHCIYLFFIIYLFTASLSQGTRAGTRPNLIIGPFYTNLAMMLEREGIPYLVTDYKGFDWIDMSRVEDRVKWKTIVEIRPPAQEQNLAVVDLFSVNEWDSAVMVMPGQPRDNQECQDLASQLLNKQVSLIPYSVEARSDKAEAMIKEILRNARLSRQRHIIVCSPRDERDKLIEKVLKEAKLFDMLSKSKQYFIFVDPSSYLQPFAGANQMYQLGLFSAQCQLLAFRYIRPSYDGTMQSAMEAASIDAARVTTLGLNRYITDQEEITSNFSDARFIEALKSVSLENGKTGIIHFNATGQREGYTLDLYKHGGEDMYERIAEWSFNGTSPDYRLNQTGIVKNSNKKPQIGIFPELVKVVVVIEEPFVMTKSNSMERDNEEEYEGFTIDLLKLLQSALNFHYEIYVSPNNQYGAIWDGMVGEIKSGNATLAMGAISITSQREAAIDFSLGVLSTGVNILVSMPADHYTIFQFLKPFSLELWMAILGSSVVVSLVYFVLDYTRAEKKFTMKETLWFSVGTLLKRGTDFSPRPISQRVLTAGFGFFVLITVATYTANMAAFLTTKNLGKTITSFESLSENDDISCGTVRNSATMNFLSMGTKPVFKRLWEKIQESDGLVSNSSEGRQRVARGNYAFMFDYLINAYSEGAECDVKAVASPILIQEHGIGMAEGAPFKTSINIELLKLKEKGKIQGLKKKWWDDKRKCNIDVSNKKKSNVQFGISHTAGVFILGAFGISCGVAFFLFKKFYLLAKPSSGNTDEEDEKEKKQLCDASPGSVSRSSKHSIPTPV
ncbi:glutamate receptor 2 [Patella vulgata]|uniref:glutamate receptor 2 n=1 Tax=Patella vulgata TaxID=6465 RepID=UPI00217FCD50|nr:glutamate receptor 2 [Patella vulgata]